MARGAVQAMQAAKLGKQVFIAGADADAANVDYVCEGKQSVEVLKDIKPLAEKAAEVAAQLARTGMVARSGGKTPVAAVAVEPRRARQRARAGHRQRLPERRFPARVK